MRKRLTAAALVLCILLTIAPVNVWAEETSGTWGTLTWSYNMGSKTLTLEGSGPMPHNDQAADRDKAPFYSYRSQIEEVVIGDGITNISNQAFFGYTALTRITIPNSVTSIDRRAFENCKVLTAITIPDNVTSIGDYAFFNCAALTDITFSTSGKLASIGESAFSSCDALVQVALPEGVTSIGKDAFRQYDNSKLHHIYIPKSVQTIGSRAFNGSPYLSDCYYGGTREDFDKITLNEYDGSPFGTTALHYGAAKVPDITANDADTLQRIINEGVGARRTYVYLTGNIDLVDKTLTIPEGCTVWLDLRGHHITSTANPVIDICGGTTVPGFYSRDGGNLTVKDSNAVNAPVVTDNNVTYSSGVIRGSAEKSSKQSTIRVREYGSFTLESGTVCSDGNIAIYAKGSTVSKGPDKGSVSIKGGYVEAQECAVLVWGIDALVSVKDGVLLSRDNAVLSGNGSLKDGLTHSSDRDGTDISMYGGTLISKITPESAAKGYIPCGIYNPQKGWVNLSGGTIHAEGGVGVLMRGGNLTIFGPNCLNHERAKTPTIIVSGSSKGFVGDSKQQVDAGKKIVLDQKCGYYDSDNIRFSVSPEAAKSIIPTAYVKNNFTLKTDYDWAMSYEPLPSDPPSYVNQDSPEEVKAQYANRLYSFQPLNSYTVTFDSQGGSAVDAQAVVSGGKVTKPSNPTRTGYTFGGWYKEAACTTAWDFDTDTVTAAVTLYAKWTALPKKYSITFDLNYSGASVLPPVETNTDGKLDTLPTPTVYTDHTFLGWYPSKTGGIKITLDIKFTKDTTVYALWEETGSTTPTTHTVKFYLDKDDTTKVHVAKETKADRTIDWPDAPKREGYTFEGWADAAGQSYETGAEFFADTSLYAQWKKDDAPKGPFTITLDANGGILSMGKTAETGEDGKLAALPKDPARAGYTFSGWYTEKTGGTEVTTDTVFTANTTIYAQWKKETSDTPSSGESYHIEYPDRVTGGTFDVSRRWAKEGTRITIELDPRSNYELDELEVINLDTGRAVYLTERYADEYTFTMPASDVEIFLSYQRRDSGGGYYIPADPVIPMTGWYYQNGRIYTAAGELVPDWTLLTRDMLLSILYNREGGGAEGYQTWATRNGIVPDYYKGDYYGTDKPLTREQTAMILYCYARYKSYNTAQRSQLTGYSDYRDIRPMAQTAMSWARGANLMTGTTATTLSPTANLTCGQGCILLSRFAANVSWGW